MPLKIVRTDPSDELATGALIADRRLWLNAGGTRVVEDGDRDAAFLLAAPGRPIAKDTVDRLGLELVDDQVQQRPVKRAAPKPNKMAKPAADKGTPPPSEKPE